MSYVTKRYTVGFLSLDARDDLDDPAEVDSSEGPKAAAEAYLRQYPPDQWYGVVAVLDPKGHRVFRYEVEAVPRLHPYSPAGSAVAV